MPRRPYPQGIMEEVQLPSNPFYAAMIYLSVLAYPANGEGQPGSSGHKFFQAMGFDLARRERKIHPDRYRDQKLPTLREIEGDYMRGIRRIGRRMAARDLAAGMHLQAMSVATVAVRDHANRRGLPPPLGPSLNQVRARRKAFAAFVLPNLEYWAKRLSERKRPPGVGDRMELLKKVRADYRESMPVLNLAQALYQHWPSDIWADQTLTFAASIQELVWRAPEWIWLAVDQCKRDELLPHWQMTLEPTASVRIRLADDAAAGAD